MAGDSQARAALAEWVAVAVLLLGCALAAAGVMAMVASRTVAFALIIAGVVVGLLGAVAWTLIVKRRDPKPEWAKQEL